MAGLVVLCGVLWLLWDDLRGNPLPREERLLRLPWERP